jgi:Cu-Zn family superoxide dismutase
MHRSFYHAAVLAVPLALVWGGCGDSNKTHGEKVPVKAEAHEHDQANPFAGVTLAVCVLSPTEGSKAAGVLRFVEKDGKVTITGEVTGLAANQKHAIHVHEAGDISDGAKGMATGGHYNPEGHSHALPGKGEKRHAGDFGNLSADADGKAKVELTFDNITVAGGKNPIIGRAIIVHAKEDDGTTQPTGNAGGRIAQGVIGIGKAPAPAPAAAPTK